MSRPTKDTKNPDATAAGKVYESSAIPVRHGPAPSAALPKNGQQAGRRRRRSVGKAIMLGFLILVGFAGTAVGYSLLQPTIHGARAELILTPRPELSDTSLDREMVTQTMVMQSDLVLAPVAAQAGIPLNRLRSRVSAEIIGRSNILRLTVGDRDRARAVHLTQLISTEYLRISTAPAGAATVPPAAAVDRTRPVTPSVLTAAAPLAGPLQPQPLRALAAGTLLGLLAAAAAVSLMMRSRFAAQPSPRWE
jgi:uncharacterized protein involved in exopolysaccharide biosynthesis